MITKDNFIVNAMRIYDNPSCKTLVEFEEDLSKFQHLSRVTSREFTNQEAQILLNVVMQLLNNFLPDEAIKMMFFKVKRENWPKLKTALVFLNRMPPSIPELGVKSEEIETCQSILKSLNSL